MIMIFRITFYLGISRILICPDFIPYQLVILSFFLSQEK